MDLSKFKFGLDSFLGMSRTRTRALSSMTSSALEEEYDSTYFKIVPAPPTPAFFTSMIHQKMDSFCKEQMGIGDGDDAKMLSQVSKYYFDGNGKAIRYKTD